MDKEGREERLRLAKKNLEKVRKISYPEGFKVGSWWESRQNLVIESIQNFKTCEDVVNYAQNGHKSGFDHRREDARGLTYYKTQEIKRLYPGFLEKNKDLQDSEFSLKETVYDIDGSKYSNIFLTHVNCYLRSRLTFDNLLSDEAGTKNATINRVIEIGGGYGGLARIFKLLHSDVCYTIVDLLESLFFAYIFLSLNFPELKILFIQNNQDFNYDDYDIVLVPVQFCNVLRNEEYDIVVNTGSLQEMPDVTVKFWMNFIQNVIRVRLFYSWNYFLNNKKQHKETGDESNLMCPLLDQFWDVKYFKINPKIITVDANGRNWLELCAERIPVVKQDKEREIQASHQCYEISKYFSPGSDDWFQNIWVAITKNRSEKKFILEMLKGIDIYKKGLGARNNTYQKRLVNLRDVLKLNIQYLKFKIKKFLRYKDSSTYSEEEYYESILKK